MSDVDFVEVGREGHELELRHGRDAWKYAKRYSEQASVEGKPSEAAFWLAVENSLKPR
jgi:hypothetical protein